MSKIFQASKIAEGEIAALIGQAVPEQSESATAASMQPIVSAPARPAPPPLAAPADVTVAALRCLSIQVPDSSPLLPFDGEHRLASEQYRMIRTKILQHPANPRMILITSAGPGDGKSVTAINLAGVLSLKSGAKTILVDADLRRPAVHTRLGIPQTPGLGGVLAGQCTLEEAMIRIEQFPGLTVLPAGESKANPAELLDSTAWRETCRTLRASFDHIILDSPPIAAVADGALMISVCDGVVIVVRPDHTDRNLCKIALEMVPKAKCIGVLLNHVQPWFLDKYLYGGSYSYYYEGDRS